ncbi:DUF4395 domain-containing protein [Spongisporangium articulatum]|uniref:DUF4395 domain-containing protein n=1 Tax=Spongisporangium articulatum TaxID=3362603 RepID=A0ABW8AJT1_9ACTN
MTSTTPATAAGIDPRGPRFAAAVTTVVLAVALVLDNVWVLLFQAVVFAIASGLGLGASPYGWLYRTFVRPRLGPPAELEDPAPPRFAQTVGLVVTAIGVVLSLAGVTWAVTAFGALAIVAAFLNAAFGLCIGCEMYLAIARLRSRPA